MSNDAIHDLCIGIDLGTTNSVLATVNQRPNGELKSTVIDLKRAVDVYTFNGKAKPQMEKKPTLPSCVYYNEDNNYRPIVGNFAKNRYAVRPHLVAKSIKSHMGEKDVSNLGFADEIPDKTPAQIASRILQHMLREAGAIFHKVIEEAVITVPANFDSIMVKATRDAAALAGIKVFNNDGSERPIILEEPKAVLYDFINKAANGEISEHIIDLSTKKNIMVFDLGGGTLDITLHEVKRREDCQDIIKVDDIAINRYTLLGGDNFDQALAEEMYRRFLQKYANREDVVRQLKKDEKAIMSQLLTYAEDLKLDLSVSIENEAGGSDSENWWGDEDEDEGFNVGGNVGSTGFSYDDVFTREEIEAVYEEFMGRDLSVNDYKKIDQLGVLTNTNNIVYPILDVLNKAAKKLGTDEVKVDAVILNGGMSKFYMIKDRLRELFGFEPIEAMDPDQAVARGAAVYHYYLKKTEFAISDDMRTVGDNASEVAEAVAEHVKKQQSSMLAVKQEAAAKKNVVPLQRVEWGRNIINDSLYLGTSNNTRVKIIATGTELPYTSEILKGFQLMPNNGNGRIDIPIQLKNIDGKTYRTIAKGQINFNKKYASGAYVVLKVEVSRSKIITMYAWTCSDVEGQNILENGVCRIEISDNDAQRQKQKLVSMTSNKLEPNSILNSLSNIFNVKKKQRWQKHKIKECSAKAAILVNQIISASNLEDFAKPVIKAFSSNSSCEEYKCRLAIIGRKICHRWTERERQQFADACIGNFLTDMYSLEWNTSAGGEIVNTRIQSIYALSVCGTEGDVLNLKKLRQQNRYYLACLYTFGKRHLDIPWLYECLVKDCDLLIRKNGNGKSYLQNTSHAIGLAFNSYVCKDENEQKLRNNAAIRLTKVLQTDTITGAESICSIIALGLVCDQRNLNEIRSDVLREAENVLTYISKYVYLEDLPASEKSAAIALKLMKGDNLTEDEEKYLLKKLELD